MRNLKKSQSLGNNGKIDVIFWRIYEVKVIVTLIFQVNGKSY